MKRLFKYIILLPLLLAVSCVYDEGLSIEDVLKVSDNTFEFTAAGDEIEFTIESYCGWEIKCEADWLSFSDYEGESKDIKNVLTVSENLSVNARTAQAEIFNDRYGINIKLNISQEAGAPYIQSSIDSLEYDEDGGVEEIRIESNISWKASVDVDWIELSPQSGESGVTTMTINIDRNVSVDCRSAVISVVNSEYDIKQEISVVQSEFVPMLRVNREKIEDVSVEGSIEEIRIESNIPWEASVDVAWIELSPQSGESGVTTMTINIDKNVSVDRRSAVVNIVNSEYDIKQEISVVQSEFVPELKVNREKIEDVSVEGSIEEIEIVSNISWEASVDVDWISISPKSGLSGVTTMTINVNNNISVASRSAVIRIVNSEYDIKQEILVVQSEFVPMLRVNREKIEDVSVEGSIEEIRIESNVPWEASVDVDWIELSPQSGESGVTTMTINIDKNVSVDRRSAVVNIVNSEYDIKQEISVVQSEFVPMLRVNREKIEDVSVEGSIEEIRIESNVPWEASVDVDWIELSPQSGESGVTIMTINIDRNVSVDRRSAVISIVNSEYDIKQDISVVQSEFVPMLRVNREKIEDVSVEGSIEEIEIVSNISWEVSVDDDWIELSPQSGESGVTTMTINIDRNVSVDRRSAVVNIVNSEYDIKQEISVVQSEFVPELKVNVEKLENISFDGLTEEIEIVSNISWEASVDVDWIELSPQSGESGVTIMTINIDRNVSVDRRSAVISIVNSEYDIKQDISVVQSEFVPMLRVNREKIEDVSVEGSIEEIEIVSNISWEVSVDVDWIEVSPKSGLSSVTTMTIDVNKNTSVVSRSAVIRIVNSEYEIEEEILVVQSEFVPELKVNVEKLENISFDGSSEEVRIDSNISWEASVDVGWIEISPKSGLSGVTTMTINVNKNASVESRSAVIRIVNSEYEIEEEILVVQSEFVPELKVNRKNIRNVSLKGSTEEIEIESNVSWEALVDVDWIEISPKSGVSGVCTMTIVVGENVLEESREGIITLKNEEYSLTMYVKIQQNKCVPNINGYEYVDLGLPSGLKWATCNVGASSPEKYGDYYAWGEIEIKSEYTKDNSKTYDKSMSDISGNAAYDVARAKWGGSWRLPTKEEFSELIKQCRWQWTIQNGTGYKVTGPNGNSIFLPATGFSLGSSIYMGGERGGYWSSTPYESVDNAVYNLYFKSSKHEVEVDWYGCYYGQSVRPVSE